VKCPFCQTNETKVIDSRINQTGDLTRRRRECPHCSGRFTTYERIEEIMPAVIKKDGRREPFLREKIFSGIQKACQKRPITTQQIEQTVLQIEKLIQSYGLKEIPAKSIGEMVMTTLHKLDKVAFIRFASVYRDFTNVDDFVNDLQLQSPQFEENARENLSFPFLTGDTEGTT
jgi:transcriptional repressor NrdR